MDLRHIGHDLDFRALAAESAPRNKPDLTVMATAPTAPNHAMSAAKIRHGESISAQRLKNSGGYFPP